MSTSGRMDRRAFLRLSLGAAAGSALSAEGLAAARGGPAAMAAVIVRFGGGVRLSEMWTKSGMRNIPFLSQLARQGTFFPRMYNRGRIDHLAGTYHILTGTYGWPEWGKRPTAPTIFEYARKDLGWGPEEALVISHRGEVDFATFGTHADYGARFGATRLSPEMVEIDQLERSLRKVSPDSKQKPGLEARLSAAKGREKGAHDQGDRPLPGHDRQRVGQFVRHLSERRPPAGFQSHGDDLATWYAMEAAGTLAPRLLFLSLGSTDQACTGRWSDYINAIQRCDWLTGRLYAAVQGEDRYRRRTLFVVVPDHGRCGDDHAAGGFQSYAGADESCKRISCVIEGPGVRAGRIVDRPCEQIDVLPTVAKLMGFKASLAEGKVLEEALE